MMAPRPIFHERYKLNGRSGALIHWKFSNEKIGIGDCFPWPEFGDLSLDEQLKSVYSGQFTEITENSYRWANIQAEFCSENLRSGAVRSTTSDNHFLVRDRDEVSLEKLKKLESLGYSRIKIKIGAGFKAVISHLNDLFADRELAAGSLKIRLDWNAQGNLRSLQDLLAEASSEVRNRIEFIEDPFLYSAEEWAIANDLIPLALDQEERHFDWSGKINFAVLVIKPARQNTETLLQKAVKHDLKVVVTSSMDHPVGLAFAIYEQSRLKKAEGARILPGGCDGSYLQTLVAESKWFESSGSSTRSGDSVKKVSLPMSGLEISAASVNSHLKVTASDIWALALSDAHVGGFAIKVRARLGGNRVIEINERWQPKLFLQKVVDAGVTLISLVPTQLFDLVSLQLPCPTRVRAVLIGGAALSKNLYLRARELGWPVLPTYGLTELGSSVAIAELESLGSLDFPNLRILNHCQVKLLHDGKIQIRSESLLNGYVQNERWHFVADEEGYLTTEDLGEIISAGDKTFLRVVGRNSDFVKILGRGVNLSFLNEKAHDIFGPTCWIQAEPDERRGHRLMLVVESGFHIGDLFTKFNSQVSPSETLSDIRVVDKIPRTALGKVLREQI